MEEDLKVAGDEAELSEAAVSDVTYEPARRRPQLRDPGAPQKAQAFIDGLGGRGDVVKVEPAAEMNGQLAQTLAGARA